MPALNDLMKLDGVAAAFQYSDKGELEAHQIAPGTDLNETVLDLLCHVCIANMAIATMQARGWEKMTGMQGFYPIEGFTFVGFDWTAIVNAGYGVVVPNSKVDYEAAYAALGQ
ncbi:MAG: DUF2173 family protein [Gammaproteobacteria bacterium]